mmetsp:Transcript_31145/g.70425  ORF Transcript_31145/g.70425 Transcript_31145/m.70425 type:complete len:184 (+) Transcript_31145:55-606(+)
MNDRKLNWSANYVQTRKGDFASPHNDYRNGRFTTFVWYLSEWKNKWGGSFYWSSTETMETGYVDLEYNSLLLFLPSTTSVHLVTPVTQDDGHPRLTYTGSWLKPSAPLNTDLPIEDMEIPGFLSSDTCFGLRCIAFLGGHGSDGKQVSKKEAKKQRKQKQPRKTYKERVQFWNAFHDELLRPS